MEIKGENIRKYVGKKEDRTLLNELMRYKVFKDKIKDLNKINKTIDDLFRDYKRKLVKEFKK